MDYPFPQHDAYSLYELHATSLRLSNIGYKNQEAALLNVSYDSLEAYVATLYHATRTPYPPYEALGIFVDGDYRQLNADLLQFENEYYGSIRPKRVPQYGERPLAALARGGVQYVELRSLDVNAFEPTGVNEEELRFLEAFLLFCLLQESPPLDIREKSEAAENQTAVAHRGRQPGLRLRRNGQEIALQDWASTLMALIADVGALLDEGLPDQPYVSAIRALQKSIDQPDRTPSARVLHDMEANQRDLLPVRAAHGRATPPRARSPAAVARHTPLSGGSQRRIATANFGAGVRNERVIRGIRSRLSGRISRSMGA